MRRRKPDFLVHDGVRHQTETEVLKRITDPVWEQALDFLLLNELNARVHTGVQLQVRRQLWLQVAREEEQRRSLKTGRR